MPSPTQSRSRPSALAIMQTVHALLPNIKREKDKLRADLTEFLHSLEFLVAANAEHQGHAPVTERIWGPCQTICKLSRGILFALWPDEDGLELTNAVMELFLVAADHFPNSTPEFPLLNGYQENLRLRALDLQPYVRSAGS